MIQNLSLKKQFITGFLIIIIGSIILTIITFSLAIFWWFNEGYKMIAPADHFEKKIGFIENYVQKKHDDILHIKEKEGLQKIIPKDGIKYGVLDSNLNMLYGNIPNQLITKDKSLIRVVNLQVNNPDDRNNLIYYIPILNRQGELKGAIALNYSLAVSYISPWWFLVVLALFASPFIYIVILTLIISHLIGKSLYTPIKDLIEGSNRIKNQNLNFELKYDGKNELGDLFKSFEQMRRELKKSLSREWSLEQQRQDYINAISHDLKTPLTIIRGHSEALSAGMWQDKILLLKYLSTIESNVDRISKLINELNLINELEHYSFDLTLREVDVGKLFNEKIQEFSQLINEKSIHLTVKNNVLNKYFNLDIERINQVLDNILINTLRFTPQNGLIHIDILTNDTKLEFHIYDSGPGFRTNDFSNIFKKHYQENRVSSKDKIHSGLGLYIVKTIIDKHKGSIFAENSVRGGAHIWFVLPDK